MYFQKENIQFVLKMQSLRCKKVDNSLKSLKRVLFTLQKEEICNSSYSLVGQLYALECLLSQPVAYLKSLIIMFHVFYCLMALLETYTFIYFQKNLHTRSLQVFSIRQYTKNSYGDLTPFLAENDGEKWFRKKYFEIQQWPSEIPANLPGQFSLSGQIFLYLAAATKKTIAGTILEI